MMGIESQMVAGMLAVFGGNIFLFSLFVFGLLGGIVAMFCAKFNIPFLLGTPLFVYVFFLMTDIPVIGQSITMLIGLAIGIGFGYFIYRTFAGG